MTKIKNNYFSEIFEKDKAILAPMAGITSLPYRIYMKEMGCKILVSEMVSAKGMFYNNNGTLRLMKTDVEEHDGAICGLQIFGSDPYIMGEITKKYVNETEFDFIDINMGCPMKKIVNNGDGSALLKNLGNITAVLKAVKCNTTKPVSAKVRLGFEEKHILDILKAVEDGGADMIAVHGRTREQVFSGEVDYDEIRKAGEVASIPFVVNGDLNTAKKAMEMMEYTHADAVMIGRGANYNPFIFSQFNELLAGREKATEYNRQDIMNVARKHFEVHVKYSDKDKAVKEFRKFLYWYIKGMKDSAKIRGSINTINDSESVYAVFDLIDNILKGELV